MKKLIALTLTYMSVVWILENIMKLEFNFITTSIAALLAFIFIDSCQQIKKKHSKK